MWFKMGGQNMEESATAEAAPVVEVAGGNTIADAGLGGGLPQNPEAVGVDSTRDPGNVMATPTSTETGQVSSDFAPAPIGGADRSSVNALNNAVAGMQADQALRDSGYASISTEPGNGFGQNVIDATESRINTNPDGSLKIESVSATSDSAEPDLVKTVTRTGRIPWNSPNHPRFKNAAGPGQAPEVTQDGTSSGDGQANVASIQSEVSGGDGNALQDQVEDQIVGGPPAAETAAPGGVVSGMGQPIQEVGGTGAPVQAVVEGVASGTENSSNTDPGATGDGASQGASEAKGADMGEASQVSGQPGNGESASEDAPLGIESSDAASAVVGDSNPDGNRGATAPSQREVLTDEQEDALSDSGVLKERSFGQVIDATTPADPFGIPDENGDSDPVAGPKSSDEVVPTVVGERTEAPEAPADEVVTDGSTEASQAVESADAPADSAVVEDAAPAAEIATDTSKTPDTTEAEDNQSDKSDLGVEEVVAGGSTSDASDPAAEGTADVSAVAPEAGIEPDVDTGDAVQDGSVGSDSAEEPVAEVVPSEEPAEPAVESTDPATANVVEDLIKPLEDIMSMNLPEEIDRLSKLDANARSTEIKRLIQSGIRAKLKQDGKENFTEAFDSMEDLEKKINAAQMVLEYLTSESELVDSRDSSQTPQSTTD